ncbi:nuclear transport factor 2 family protein [Aliiroseovarius sp. 2305UL8-7]|uniref:nuclear transport factor 2 family protein n=1 Tax=Aliiroseovarius conchicola TaxID=3121637 RepID=UPI003528BE63
MKHLLVTTATLLSLAIPAFAGEEENKVVAIRALTEMFDAQNVELIDELYHPDYIQHSPSIADGRDGIRAGVTWMKENGMKPQREIARVLAQGDLVGIQARVSFGEDTAIVGDIFRFEDGQIIEHWDTTQAEVPQSETANGNSMIDGGGDVDKYVSTMDLARNTMNAVRFFDTGIAGDIETLKELFGDEYIQHNPMVPNGIEPIFGFFKDSDGTLSNVTVHQTISDGDLTMALVEYADWGNAVIEIVRHDEEGKIVEHWDIVQKIPAAEDFAHDNGMF